MSPYELVCEHVGPFGNHYIRTSRHSSLEDAERMMRETVVDEGVVRADIRIRGEGRRVQNVSSWIRNSAGIGCITRQSTLATPSTPRDGSSPSGGD